MPLQTPAATGNGPRVCTARAVVGSFPTVGCTGPALIADSPSLPAWACSEAGPFYGFPRGSLLRLGLPRAEPPLPSAERGAPG